MKKLSRKLKKIKTQLESELNKENIGIISERSTQILNNFDKIITEVVQRERLSEETTKLCNKCNSDKIINNPCKLYNYLCLSCGSSFD